MGKGYYWIEPVDQTLNDFQFYKARIVGDPEYDEKHHRVILRTDKYFPVGSIFHVLKDPEMFVIERKFKTWVADSCMGTAASNPCPHLPPPSISLG